MVIQLITLDSTQLGRLIKKIYDRVVKKSETTEVQSVGIDNTPTKNSTNLVESGGVFSALGKWGVVSQTQTWRQIGQGYTGPFEYTMSNPVNGFIPNSFIELWSLRGGNTAKFNENTGYFEFLDLVDISYQEAQEIYKYSVDAPDNEAFTKVNCRTFLPFLRSGHFSSQPSYGLISACRYCESFIYDDLHGHGSTKINNSAYLMHSCSRMKKVFGILDVSGLSTQITLAFNGMYTLEQIQIKGLKVNIELKSPSLLNLESVVYMVSNATNTAAITITLHATAYARCQADTTEYEYNGQTYTGIIAYAAAKNITIASA